MTRARPRHCRLTVLLTVLTAIAWASAIASLHAGWSDDRGLNAPPLRITEALSTSATSGATATALYPGTTGDVWLAITNPNPYPVYVTEIALDGTDADIAPDPGHPGCTTTGVSFRDQSGLTIDIPANATVETRLDDAAAMSNASVDGCQGATFAIPLTVSGSPAR